VKALTVWQPWATLIASGAKMIETRAWWTAYRGPLAIHAGATLRLDCRELCAEEPFRSALRRAGITDPRALPLAKVLAIADLIDCRKIRLGGAPHAGERAFGDYTSGRYAWCLGNVRALRTPMAAVGHQGLWEWAAPAELEEALRGVTERGRAG